ARRFAPPAGRLGRRRPCRAPRPRRRRVRPLRRGVALRAGLRGRQAAPRPGDARPAAPRRAAPVRRRRGPRLRARPARPRAARRRLGRTPHRPRPRPGEARRGEAGRRRPAGALRRSGLGSPRRCLARVRHPADGGRPVPNARTDAAAVAGRRRQRRAPPRAGARLRPRPRLAQRRRPRHGGAWPRRPRRPQRHPPAAARRPGRPVRSGGLRRFRLALLGEHALAERLARRGAPRGM
ncbi:MAG: hypothetical protein AVDCRST_MAG04-1762, partial [uncultured Acetobacteraceae bacterium]